MRFSKECLVHVTIFWWGASIMLLGCLVMSRLLLRAAPWCFCTGCPHINLFYHASISDRFLYNFLIRCLTWTYHVFLEINRFWAVQTPLEPHSKTLIFNGTFMFFRHWIWKLYDKRTNVAAQKNTSKVQWYNICHSRFSSQ